MYNPTYGRDKKGNFNSERSIASIFAGTDAYLIEDEMNELQWVQNEARASFIRKISQSGFHTKGNLDTALVVPLNSFVMDKSEILVNGYELCVANNKLRSDLKNTITISSPPTTDTRKDLVFLEAWFEEINGISSTVYSYGGVESGISANNLVDGRIGFESSRRVQLRWRIRVVDNVNTTLFADGINDNSKVFAFGGNTANTSKTFSASPYDSKLFVAGAGTTSDKTELKSIDGYVYAVKMFIITRYNSSTYNSSTNPNGAPLYVNESSTSPRPDSRFSNIIYLDQIQDDRHQAETRILKYFSNNSNTLSLNKDLAINGNLSVTGTTTTVNTSNLNVSNNSIILNSDFSGNNPTLDARLQVERGNLSNTEIIWDETLDKWRATADGINYYDILLSNQKGSPNGVANLDAGAKLPFALLPGVTRVATATVDKNGKGDYSTIQAAINFVGTNGMVIIREGVYNENITLSSGITLMGMGFGTKIVGTSTIPTAVISGDSVSNVRISNLLVEPTGNTGGNSGICISLVNCSNVTIDNCNLIASKSYGVLLDSNKLSSITDCVISNAVIAGIHDNGDVLNADLDGNKITSNRIDNCAVGIEIDANAKYDLVSNNILRKCTANIINSGSNNLIVNNIFRP